MSLTACVPGELDMEPMAMAAAAPDRRSLLNFNENREDRRSAKPG